MASIYSTRFIELAAAGSQTYAVPSGHLAVVRSIVAVNAGGSSSAAFSCQLTPSGVYLCFGTVQAPVAGQNVNQQLLDMHVSVLAGEVINGAVQAGASLVVSGYLFTG